MSESLKNNGFLVPLSKESRAVAIKELKPPAANRGRNNEIILEEEEYLKNLEKIVNRNFFPLLHQADISSGNYNDFESATHMSGISSEKLQNDIDRLSVDQYMAKYNSEDNASFEKLLDKDEEAYKKKYGWMIKQTEEWREKQLAIQAGSGDKLQNMIEGNREPYLMLGMSEEQSNLMFMPITKSNEIMSYSAPNSAEQKGINYDNTRFDPKTLLGLIELGESRQSTSNGPLPIDTLRTPSLIGYEYKKPEFSFNKSKEPEVKANIRGYNLISMPSPSPNEQTPMMTWGEVDTTPLLLDRQKTFKIQQSSLRDELTANMPLEIEKKKKQSQVKQKQKMKELLTPSPMRKDSSLRLDPRRPSSILPNSKLIKRETVDKSQLLKQNIQKAHKAHKVRETNSISAANKKELLKSTKGLTDDLLHFE